MKKMHTEDWRSAFKRCRKNHLNLLFNPFYTRKKLIADAYKKRVGREPNLKEPSSFTEKLNANKLNSSLQKKYSYFADKHSVRNYVSKKIGSQYLIPEYLYTKKIKYSDLKNLPDKFVLKTTNGSGTNYIVLNKHEENLKDIASYMNWLSNIKYGYLWGEFFYNYIRPGIIAEQLLLDKNGSIPDDLKCFCFKDKNNIRRKILYLERVVGDERLRAMFDENWIPLDYASQFGKLDVKLKKPKNYKEILYVLDKLSEDFNFVRVDLLILDNKIYFGELTFMPTAGYMKFTDDKIDKLWGEWIGDETITVGEIQ